MAKPQRDTLRHRVVELEARLAAAQRDLDEARRQGTVSSAGKSELRQSLSGQIAVISQQRDELAARLKVVHAEVSADARAVMDRMRMAHNRRVREVGTLLMAHAITSALKVVAREQGDSYVLKEARREGLAHGLEMLNEVAPEGS